jgi:hypothetical protein
MTKALKLTTVSKVIINVECGSEKYFDADIAGDLNITRTRRVLRESYDDLGEHNALAGGDLEYCENNVNELFEAPTLFLCTHK